MATTTTSPLVPTAVVVVALVTLLMLLISPAVAGLEARALGWYLRRKTEGRKQFLLSAMEADELKHKAKEAKKSPLPELPRSGSATLDDTRKSGRNDGSVVDDWAGTVGFFHPFCNAVGGGERVLWAAIRATQRRWPRAKCFVYTGDHDASKDQILARVKDHFNISIYAPSISFLYLTRRKLVLPSTWPRFTLAGQSLGSVVLAYDALSLLVPDIFVDTMGYAFAISFAKALFPSMPTGAYVHYPTISTDMLGSLDDKVADGDTADADTDVRTAARGLNAGQGKGIRGAVKRMYWLRFARWYSHAGAAIDVAMANSTWTQAHVETLWGPRRRAAGRTSRIQVVYPPCAVADAAAQISVDADAETRRRPDIVYIAQFRPEKNHQLVLNAFARFAASGRPSAEGARLLLVGSVRDDADSKRIYQLRLAANELGIRDRVEFRLDASWPDVLDLLGRASVGVNGMWNEHFGIGVVEYQAAGLVSVVHDSGGPKADIVTEIDGGLTGFHATSAQDFADAFDKALSLPNIVEVRQRARRSAQRFTEEEFARKWTVQMEQLVAMVGRG